MMLMFIILLIVSVGVIVWLLIDRRRLSHEIQRLSTLVENLSSYAFLIDKDFLVHETNYYALNPTQAKTEPQVLGNVLHCSVACKSGRCGHGLECNHCPVRFVITKAFERKGGFSDLEVAMVLQNADNGTANVDVNVGGRYVNVGGIPYMVINVKDVSETKRLLRRYIDQQFKEESDPAVRKVLFATRDVARYNDLRELLKDTCRLVYVETPEQVLHRVGKDKDRDSGYSVVMLDETFLHEFDIVSQLNEHIIVVKLTTDGMAGLAGRELSIPLSIGNEELKGIIARQFKEKT